MKKNHILIATLIALGMPITMTGKPAMRDIRTVKQPDGTELKIRIVGDENMHFTLTQDGYLLKLDADGFYRYGKIDKDGAVISTGIEIGKSKNSTDRILLRDIDKSIIQKAKMSKRRAPQSGYGLFDNSYPTTGSPKGLVILVEYKDVKFNKSYNATEYFNDMINGDNFTQYGGTGSALRYFRDQSGDKFIPSFDVLGPVTLPNNRSYYGGNDRNGEDKNAHLMVTHAIEILDSTVDFSIYDTDKDGMIDNVYVFYAGQGEADYGPEDSVWPHSWDVTFAGIRKKVDGVFVGKYACSNEWGEKTPDGVGTFVHEFSHVMGLPDLYVTDRYLEDSYTPDAYSVMDYGPYNNDGRTPPNYGAYERNSLNWYEPIMLNESKSVTLHEISSGEFGLIPTGKDTEFFLLENRQLKGWDKYIPNHGMLIWHIDYVESVFLDNSVNNTQGHQYVDIEEANNKRGWDYLEGYTFPGTNGKTSFTATTTPALKSWDGKAIDLPITEITEQGGLITFNVAGGGSSFSSPTPIVNEYSKANMYFVAEWPPVENAVEYFISVYGGDKTASGTVSTGFDGSKIPDGWIATATDWYATANNYGKASPSYKFGKDGQSLTSPVTDGDIEKIEFWAKGQSSKGTTLKIEGLKDGKWIPITEYSPLSNKTENVTIDNEIPSGIRQIKFTISKSVGNIAFDDITISFGGGSVVLPNYDNLSLGKNTNIKVDKLLAGEYNYYFTVSATDGKNTRKSQPVYVTLDGEKGTNGISGTGEAEIEPEYYNLQGLKISHPKRGELIIEKKGDSIRKIIF